MHPAPANGRNLENDETLLSLIVGGDERALERLYDRYGRAIYSLALRMLRDTGAAEEVVQEVFLKLWRRPTSYVAGRGTVVTWLLSVAHHRAVDELRSRRHVTLSLDGSPDGSIELVDEAEDLNEMASIRERRGVVRSALSGLPGSQRAAIELAYYGGLTQREIAERLGEPLGTVKTRMRLAMQKLRVSLLSIDAPDVHVNGTVNGAVRAREAVRRVEL